MSDLMTNYVNTLVEQRHQQGSFDFNWTPQEDADKERVLRETGFYTSVNWKCERRGCWKLHHEETTICEVCGSPVSGVPF